jgi:hypothetical protein
MPEDWFGEAEADAGNIANNPDLRLAMETAYQEGIEAMEVDHIIGRLKDRCMAAAKPAEKASETT